MNKLNICFVCLLLCCCTNAHKYQSANPTVIENEAAPDTIVEPNIIVADNYRTVKDTTFIYSCGDSIMGYKLYINVNQDFNKTPNEITVSTEEYNLTFGLYETRDSTELITLSQYYDADEDFFSRIAKINILNEHRTDTLKSVTISRNMFRKYPWLGDEIKRHMILDIKLHNDHIPKLEDIAFEIVLCVFDTDVDSAFLYYPFRPEEEAFEFYDDYYVSEDDDYVPDTTNVVENMEFVETVENTDTVGVVEDEKDEIS